MLHKLDGNVYVTSDTHYWHKAVIQYCNRPFANTYEMNQELVKRWNSRISHKDHVFHVGDFAFGSRKMILEILDALNGNIYLIKGNHDRKITGDIEKRFVWVKSDFLTSLDNVPVHFYHFPVEYWNKAHYGGWMLHGHSHGLKTPGRRRIDVGVDTNNYYPYHIEEIREHMNMVPPPGRAKKEKKVCAAEENKDNGVIDGQIPRRDKEGLTFREKLSRTWNIWTT